MPQPNTMPVVDPATASGARAKAGYLGPTAYAALQKQYTPYQLEQATRREGADIFYKEGVDINSIPRTPAPAMTPPVTLPTPDANQISAMTTAPIPPANPNSDTTALSRSISEASKAFLTTSIDKTIADLQAQQQNFINQQKQAEEAQIKEAEKGISDLTTSTRMQEAVEAQQKRFRVEELMGTYNVIQQNIIDAQAALDQGLVYEQSRPVRMQLLTGRTNTLRNQGLALIGSMQATAAVVKGQLDLAKGYADDVVEAIKEDNTTQRNALTTLLTLHQDNLVRLTEEESKTINNRLKALSDESDKMDSNKDKVFTLMTQFPAAAASGKVTFLDTQESAMAKMLPFISERDKQEWDLAIAGKKKSLSSGGGGSGTTDSDKLYAQYQKDLASLIEKVDMTPGSSGAMQYQTAVDVLRAKYPQLDTRVIAEDLGTSRKPAPEAPSEEDKPGVPFTQKVIDKAKQAKDAYKKVKAAVTF